MIWRIFPLFESVLVVDPKYQSWLQLQAVAVTFSRFHIKKMADYPFDVLNLKNFRD